jgi:hypothetical protein
MTKASQSKQTTDHEEIRKWVEDRGGKPARVRNTGRKKGDGGLLRIDFMANGPDESLEEMTWDDFFSEFDKNRLAFLYQEETSTGKESRFFKFVRRK